jgi:hypothetical protein
MGCSTYRLSDFSSKAKFYDDFNKFAKNKNVKVTAINNTVFTINNRAEIENDTLYFIDDNIVYINKIISASDTLGAIEVNKFHTGTILLKNGEKYWANNIEFKDDSIFFSYEGKTHKKNNICSLKNIKYISYKNNWIGLPLGFLGGEIFGLGIGYAVSKYIYQHESYEDQKNLVDEIPLFWGIYLGPVVGAIVGLFIGWNYIYEFSP